MAASILKNKGFLALTITQFFGALNDNAFKMIITLLALELTQNQQAASRYVSLASLIFVIPFLLFSTFAGSLADRVSKRNVAIGVKILEVLVMLGGVWALSFKNMDVLLVLLFFMALHSTFFAPAKYGLLPELMEDKDLSHANGIINLTTFLAIILGTILGGSLLKATKPDVYRSGFVFVGMALLGLLSSVFVTRVPAAARESSFAWNPLKSFFQSLKDIKKDRSLFLCTIGIGYFWFLGAILLIILPLYGKVLLHADETKISWIMTILCLGIAFGSGVAGKLSGQKVELGLVPLGSIGLGIFSLDLAFSFNSYWHAMMDLFLAGFFAGVFVIPLNALFQSRSPKEARGKLIATLNIVSFVGIGLASLLVMALTGDRGLGLSIDKSLAAVAMASLAITIYIIYLLPQAFVRLVFWLLTHTIYRIKIKGLENLPLKGPALLVCNHLSYVDPLLVAAAVSRHIRFFMLRPIYEWQPLHWFFKLMEMIPISATDGPKKFVASMEQARVALKERHMVCIFAEGSISRVAQTLGFRRGIEIVAKDLDIPIIPVHLDRVWGSIFSFDRGAFVWKLPRKIPYPVTVSFGKPFTSSSNVDEVRRAVLELGTEAFPHRLKKMLPLHRDFYRQAKREWFSKAMADSTGLRLTYGKFMTACFSMAKLFQDIFKGQKHVGVLLPPCVPGALVNVALQFAGKVPVNLNYTMSEKLVEQIVQKANIEKIITSAKMLEALGWKSDSRMIFLESMKRPSGIRNALSWCLLWIVPAFLVERIFLRSSLVKMDDSATLIFTSGSTGLPKGVMLTHNNIQANIQGLLEVFQIDSSDTLIGVLPFFHSFGYTGTIWFPLLGGFPVVYHKSPLEPIIIQKLIREHLGTVVLATPTFLQMWMKKFRKEDVSSLRFALAGAEKVKDHLAKEFFEKFGVPILEGYGCTELSPVACASVLNVKDRSVFQLGHKQGKVGRPLPGVSVRIVDPETKKTLPSGSPGLLLVKGPNVMKGYWQDPEKTAEVMLDSWYVTGDIATIDDDGFIQITDRLSRFSKIGGEMVPHILLEERLYEAANEPDAQFILTTVPDEKKGEALVVLAYNYQGSAEPLLGKLAQAGIPKLWIPDLRNFFTVDQCPTLGTGKIDMTKAKEMAQDLFQKGRGTP